MSRPSVPVIVLAGYLGSGKTTLLNHLLRAARDSGSRIGVLVNDFGAINVDALLVAGQADGTVSLGGGCVCCTVDRDGLTEALATLVRPSAALDAIVIEASGIAEPKALIRMVTGVADRRMRYGGLVYVVDAVHMAATRRKHPEFDGHVAIADLLVLNKIDLVDGEVADRAVDDLRALNHSAPLVAAAHAAIDPALMFDAAQRRAEDRPGTGQLTLDALLIEGEPHDHLHADYDSISFESTEPMNPRRLAAFLERPPDGCFRIKGLVHFDVPRHRQKYVVHAVGGFVSVQRESWGSDAPSTTLVAIGSGLYADQVRDRLASAVAVPDDATDSNGILSITRYLAGE
ncbi:GTP-binding protein [Gordonia sp. ABSL49_1]|uniref:CobW family GTP-binding protein n=1 Tax=Gordonia sp. ABSL49_1 TaxID=2920941 RepID=UPI001F0F6712|nr:GTP-binding protein [Gordonia sp. ABSL49_1]MCH5645346.1 GTP-binding protein [Gordonia sp. ABSL49_1]